MCTLSTSGSCQDDEGFQCGGGQYPCLPHWKFDDNLQYAIGTGAAPDGDADALQKIGRALRVRRLGCSKSWESSAAEDALAGMLFAVLSLERTTEPSWLPEVGSVTGLACTGTLTCMPQ